MTHQLLANDELLDLSRALIQTQQANVAVEALNLVFVDVARATVDLHTSVCHTANHLGREELGARGLHAHLGIDHACRPH